MKIYCYFTKNKPVSIMKTGLLMCGIRGAPQPQKNHKNIPFLNNTGPEPLKIKKLQCTKPEHSMVGHLRHACEMLFKQCFTGGQMMAWL